MSTAAEIQEQSVQLRAKLEREKPGCTKYIATAQDESATLDEIFAEEMALKVLAGVTSENAPGTTTEIAQLKASVALLTAENKKLTEQLDSRVAFESARKVAQLGFCDRPISSQPANDDRTLTPTQKFLKAKGLPLDTKVALADDSATDE